MHSILKISVVFLLLCGQSLGQGKCSFNISDECINTIQSWSFLCEQADTLNTFRVDYNFSNPDAILSNQSTDFKNHHLIFSHSATQDLSTQYLFSSDLSNIFVDSSSYLGCFNTNQVLDTTYCATSSGSPPPQWGTALLTLGSKRKIYYREYPSQSISTIPYVLSVPDKGFYVNDNFDLTSTVQYPNNISTIQQYALRPACLSYQKPGVSNRMARNSSSMVFRAAANFPLEIDLGLYDLDGDSVVMQYIQPYGVKLDENISFTATSLHMDSIKPYPLVAGLSPLLPLPCTSFVPSPTSNKISCIPTTQGFYNIMARIYEYRRGILVAFHDVIIGIHVYAATSLQPTITMPYNVSPTSTLRARNSIYSCINDTLSFDASIKYHGKTSGVSNYGIQYHGFPSGQFPALSIVYNNNVDSLVLRFTYVTNAQDSEWKYISIVAQDTICTSEYSYSSHASASVALMTIDATSLQGTDSFTTCAGDTLLLNTNGGLASWIPIFGDLGSLSCSSCPYPTVYPEVSTLYVSFPDTSVINCGQQLDSVYVEVVPDFDIQIFGDTVLCNNVISTKLTANIVPPSGILNYQWMPSASCTPDSLAITDIVLTTDSVWFSIRAWDDYGCQDKSDSILIRRNFFSPTADIDYDEPGCLVDTFIGTASGAWTYKWEMDSADIVCNTCDQTEIRVNIYSADTLILTMMDEIGCKEVRLWKIDVYEAPIADAGKDTVIYDGAIFSIDGSDSDKYTDNYWTPKDYLFRPNSISTEGQFIPQTGEYILNLNNGTCMNTDTVKVTVIPCVLTPIPNAFIAKGTKDENFKANMRDPNTYVKMKIFNRWGQKIYQEEGIAKDFIGWDGTINGKLQPIATYVYVIEVDCIKLDGTPGNTKLEGTFTLVY